MAVGKRNLQSRIAGYHAKSVIGEMQIADDFWAKHARDVRSSRRAATGGDLFGDAASPYNVAAFDNERGVSGAGEVRGSG
jgi:hypothetical protein